MGVRLPTPAPGSYLPSSGGDQKDPFFKQDFLSYHVKFIATSEGGVTLAWKLVRVTPENGELLLAGAGRVRTHDLLLTFGPTFNAGTPTSRSALMRRRISGTR
jgi:hypothetical protein